MPILEQDQQKLAASLRPRYLFVDDDLSILNLFKTFFSVDAEVTLASDGKDALNKLTAQSYDIIISDVDMPILNGIDLFKSLYARDPLINKRFIFCTGQSSEELQDFCFEHHIRCTNKPISLVALQAELVELCDELRR